jgi:4,5-dihydroxyphthalate decarboxylase
MFLEEDFGVAPRDVTWVRGGYEQPGRVEKIALKLPPDVRLENVRDGRTISALLASGELDAVIGPRAPSCFTNGNPHVDWLFPDPTAAASAWFRKTRMFPIMHLLGIRRSLVEQHPWLPGAALKAFETAKAAALTQLGDPSATKVTLPFVEEQLRAARALLGDDFWSYGFGPNRHTLERFLKRHHEEGLSSRLLAPEELFHPATLESHRI